MSRHLLGVVMLALASAAVPALASQPLWELGLGAGALRMPHYRGSDQSHDWLLPVPYAVYRGKIFRATREGARAVLLEGERFDFDLSADASAPASSGDNVARSGMPDLEPTVEIGPNLNVTLARGGGWKLDLRLPVRAVFTLGSDARGIGFTVSPVLNLDLQAGGWNLGLQGGPLLASGAYHAHFYGVAPAYATAERPAYDAPGGGAGWRLTAAASRRFGDLWLGGYIRTDTVAGAVFEASPLVRQRENVTFGLALSWVFASSEQRVAADR
ncbi:MAG: MipA/OmpV family protein [Rubrivivax sp.]|nr:MipA/OmpV family protein [Rubrivivax sp.]